MDRFEGKGRWLASRLIPILIVFGGVFVFELEETGKEALLASIALPFIVIEVVAFTRGRMISSDMSERAFDFIKEAWDDIVEGRWGHGIALVVGYTIACLAGFFFAILIEGQSPSFSNFLVFLKYYGISLFLVIGFYILVAFFAVKDIRSLILHGILWGLIGICLVGFLNASNDEEYLSKIGFITQLTALLFCVVVAGAVLRSGRGEERWLGIVLSITVILGLIFLSYLFLGNTSVTSVLGIVGLGNTGYIICLIGLVIFGYATVIHGVASRSMVIGILGVIILAIGCTLAYSVVYSYTLSDIYHDALSFFHSGALWPVIGISLVSSIVFIFLSYVWVTSYNGNIIFPLSASLIPPAFLVALALIGSDFLPSTLNTSAVALLIKFACTFVGFFIGLWLVKRMEDMHPLPLYLLFLFGGFLLTVPLWYN